MNGGIEVIDYDRLNAEADAMAKSFSEADPFPHIVIDNFLSTEFVARLNANFPDLAVKAKAVRTYSCAFGRR